MNGKKAKQIRRVCDKEFKSVLDKQYMSVPHHGANRYNQPSKPQIRLGGECGRFVYQKMKKMYKNGTPIA